MEITSKKIYRNNLAIVSFSTLALLLWGALIAGLVFEIVAPALFILGFFASMTQILYIKSVTKGKVNGEGLSY